MTDAAGAEVMAGRVEAVTCIELVEHLQPGQLDSFSCAVLGVIRPRVWVVTTPNREYNELFPDWPGSDQSQQLLFCLFVCLHVKSVQAH